MKFLSRTGAALALSLLSCLASATLITGGDAAFDDADNLLLLSGIYQDANVPIETFLFDWDGALDGFDFSGTSLVSSSVGGTLATPALGFNSGSLQIDSLVVSPIPTPASFSFLFSIPGADAAFLSSPIDFYLRGGSGNDFTNTDFITPVARDLEVTVTTIPVSATVILLGLGLGVLTARRKA